MSAHKVTAPWGKGCNMSYQNDREYFAERAVQESEMGDRAVTPQIAAIHYQLAYLYALRGDDVSNVIPLMRQRA